MNIPKQEEGNVRFLCAEHRKDVYPNTGKFTREQLSAATHVKVNYGGEHMWILIRCVTNNGICGSIDNYPIKDDTPRFGKIVDILFKDIEDTHGSKKEV